MKEKINKVVVLGWFTFRLFFFSDFRKLPSKRSASFVLTFIPAPISILRVYHWFVLRPPIICLSLVI